MLMKALQLVEPRSFASIQVPVPKLSSGNPDQILIRISKRLYKDRVYIPEILAMVEH